ncbi:MAG: hypothetical protein R3E31_09720 [Chloroflexota bacterium]
MTQVSYTAEWANDNRTFFYTRQDEAKRSALSLSPHIGRREATGDPLIYAESDELYRVYR